MPKGDRDNLKADCEDGFTRIANLILEALALAKLNGTQKGICLFLFRRTYGWNRSEDAISLADFAAACGSSKPYISRQLQDLISKNVICRVAYEPGKTPVYAFTTRISEWDPACIDRQALSDCATHGLYESTTGGLSDKATVNPVLRLVPPGVGAPVKTVRKTLKEPKIFPPDSVPYRLAEQLLAKILEHLPGYKPPDLQRWARQMDALLRLDQRAPEEVEAVIIFAQADQFWRTNILSVDKLRKQYDQLNARRMQPRAGPPRRTVLDSVGEGEEKDEYQGFFR